nr:MAG TPA: hypothetical protein [Caudoviricetes sp.]
MISSSILKYFTLLPIKGRRVFSFFILIYFSYILFT